MIIAQQYQCLFVAATYNLKRSKSSRSRQVGGRGDLATDFGAYCLTLWRGILIDGYLHVYVPFISEAQNIELVISDMCAELGMLNLVFDAAYSIFPNFSSSPHLDGLRTIRRWHAYAAPTPSDIRQNFLFIYDSINTTNQNNPKTL